MALTLTDVPQHLFLADVDTISCTACGLPERNYRHGGPLPQPKRRRRRRAITTTARGAA